MKKKVISTPKKWYIVALCIMISFLLLWIIFELIPQYDFNKLIIDISKNAFFAIMGSLLVSFLIDIGNTSRDNKIQEAAFQQLKSVLETIYSSISSVSFVLSNALDIGDNGDITLRHYYNNEFYYSFDNIVGYTTLKEVSSFKERIITYVEKIINSNSFLYLNDDIKKAIETLYVERFWCITQLNDNVIKSGFRFAPIKSEIDKLNKITSVLSTAINRNYSFSFLSMEDANMHHEERLQYTLEHKEEIDSMYKMLNHQKFYDLK